MLYKFIAEGSTAAPQPEKADSLRRWVSRYRSSPGARDVPAVGGPRVRAVVSDAQQRLSQFALRYAADILAAMSADLSSGVAADPLAGVAVAANDERAATAAAGAAPTMDPRLFTPAGSGSPRGATVGTSDAATGTGPGRRRATDGRSRG